MTCAEGAVLDSAPLCVQVSLAEDRESKDVVAV
jgi:hypothetical protein